jgi:hypothetical protein
MKSQNCEKSSKESELFVDFARKLISVPKKEIDEQLEREREQKQKAKDSKKRK